MASSFKPTGTVGTDAWSSSAGAPADDEADVVVVALAADAAVVVADDEADVVVVAGTRASRDTSASRSMKSSRSWMISTRRVSISSSLVSKSPQPVAARETVRRVAVRRVRVCMWAVFQRLAPSARRFRPEVDDEGLRPPTRLMYSALLSTKVPIKQPLAIGCGSPRRHLEQLALVQEPGGDRGCLVPEPEGS